MVENEPGMALTRKDLQQEFEIFAQSHFTNVLNDALRNNRDAIVKEIQDLLGAAPNKLEAPAHSVPHEFDERMFRGPYPSPGRDCSPPTSAKPKKTLWRLIGRTSSATIPLDGTQSSSFSVTHGQVLDEEESLGPRGYTLLHCRENGDEGVAKFNRKFLQRLVSSKTFVQIVGMLVVCNAISLGYYSDECFESRVVEICFCILFTIEWLMRFGAFGSDFFKGKKLLWNCFDTFLVFTQLLEQLLLVLQACNGQALRMLRLLRIIRIARLVRAFHLFDELRVMLHSVQASGTTLAWSCMLCFMLIYMFSVVFYQSVAQSSAHLLEHGELHHWFSSLSRSFLTLFQCILNGVDWDQIVTPLMEDISPFLAVLFCLYVTLAILAFLNLITGLFVERAMTTVREDKDRIVAKRVRDLFFDKANKGIHEEITWDIFRTKLGTDAMKHYFHQINVERSEARSLFDLLDFEGHGKLDSHELVRACLQLRGPARSLEVAMLHKEMREVLHTVDSIEHGISGLLHASQQKWMFAPNPNLFETSPSMSNPYLPA